MVGLVKVAIRNREQLATLRVRDGVIVLETMIWPDEVREPAFGFLDEDVEVRPQERQMAESLVASMAGDFDPTEYTDDYREALQEVIDAKIEGREVVEADEAQPTAGNVVDLMSALRASVEAAKRSRGDAASQTEQRNDLGAGAAKDPAAASAKRAPAKRAATAKAAAQTAPAKKAAAKAAATKARPPRRSRRPNRREERPPRRSRRPIPRNRRRPRRPRRALLSASRLDRLAYRPTHGSRPCARDALAFKEKLRRSTSC